MRVFARAGRLPGLVGWKPEPVQCWQCNADTPVMTIDLLPFAGVYSATLCLLCGALRLAYVDEEVDYCEQERRRELCGDDLPEGVSSYGGHDWSQPDPVVDDFRRAVRAAESTWDCCSDENGDDDWEGLDDE